MNAECLARRIVIGSEKTRKRYFHNGIVRANKRLVNELFVGKVCIFL
jgi:hypothetical protein